MSKKRNLIIEFEDGSNQTIEDSFAGEIDRAIKDFQNGKEKISIGRVSCGLEKTVISTSKIRSITPKWVEAKQ